MLTFLKKAATAATLAAGLVTATVAVVPAEAGNHQRDPYMGGAPRFPGDGYKHGHGYWNGNDWVGPLIGGMVIGGMLAAPYYGYGYAPYYAPPRYRYGSRDAYCHARFRSYSSYTKLYLGFDGQYHRC